MKDEILSKVYAADAAAIPRYRIVNKDGSIVNEGVEIQLMNSVEQEGTMFNKFNILKDSTAALYGLTSDAVPDDVFQVIKDEVEAINGIIVIVESTLGSVITATLDDTTIAAEASGSVYTLKLPRYGVWSIKMVNGDTEKTVSLNADACKTYHVTLTLSNVYGVMWRTDLSGTQLTRLTGGNDPNNYVNTSIDTEPVAGVDTSAGSSPFDDLYPWSKMEEWNVDDSGNVTHKRGDPSFSRSLYDTVVFIPPFYYKVVDDPSNHKRYFYIASDPISGFAKHPGSGRCLSRYFYNGDLEKSFISGKKAYPWVPSTQATNINSKNTSKWFLGDFATLCAVRLLYLVEFADWNSQKTIGIGYWSASASYDDYSTEGATDPMTYHTGRVTAADMVQYRHIENLWFAQGTFVDWHGANIYNGEIYVCEDPTKFAFETAENYVNTGITFSSHSGYITALGYSAVAPWAFISVATGGSSSTYIPDYVDVPVDTNWRTLATGYDSNPTGTEAGLFMEHTNRASSGYCKGLFLPTAEEIALMSA